MAEREDERRDEPRANTERPVAPGGDERQLWVRRIVRLAVILAAVAVLLWLLQSEAEPTLAGLARAALSF